MSDARVAQATPRAAPESVAQAGRWVVVRAVTQFVLAALSALAILGVTISIASRRLGEREAISDARTETVIKASGVVAPVLTGGVAWGDEAALTALDRVVRTKVLTSSLVRIKVWRKDGTIVYSDATPMVGKKFELDDEELGALQTGRINAEVSDLDEPENRMEQSFGKLLEVYLPITATDGERMLFETYFLYDAVVSNADRVWRSFAPISIAGLAVLQLVQIPLAWSLARSLRDRMRERAALTARSLEASTIERRQIAADLHDGVVQDLTGAALALSAAARERAVSGAASRAGDLEAVAATIRAAVSDLRSLVVDLAPAELTNDGLVPALAGLTERMSTESRTVSLVGADASIGQVSDETARLLYRGAEEGLRNVARHAGATSCTVRLIAERARLGVEIADNGHGFDPDDLAAKEQRGHVGLRAMRGVVGDAGGSVTVVSSPGNGCTLTVMVPR